MPTLLQINVVVNWGSTGRIAEEIGQVAIAGGWKSYIAYGRGTPKSKSHLIRIGSNWDMYMHGLQSRILDNHGLASQRATRKLITEIQEIKPDIVHLHNVHGYYLNYELLFQYLAGADIPVVWTLHDCWAFTGHCAYFTYVGCNQWKEGCFHCTRKKSYPASFVLDNAARNFELKKKSFTSVSRMTIVPVSDWLAGLVKESFLKQCSIHRIYNGVNLEVFSPKLNRFDIRKRIGVIQRYMLIGVASIWVSRKGLDDFMNLRKKLPLKEYAIVLVGLNKEQLQHLPEGIIGVSRTNSVDELAEYYSAADVFLNPTWEDNFPTTNLEALACGTPVITYRTGGSVEAVDEYAGMVVEQGYIDSLADAVRTITTRGKKHYSAACRQRAELYFNKTDRWKEYVDLYQSLIAFKATEKETR